MLNESEVELDESGEPLFETVGTLYGTETPLSRLVKGRFESEKRRRGTASPLDGLERSRDDT